MKGQIAVGSPAEYIRALEEPRKTEVASLDALIRKTAPKLKPAIQSGILVYGPFRYRYATGREGDTAKLAVASNKSYISLYVNCLAEGGYMAESFKEALPKASIGKACVRFKRLSDLDLEALKRLIAAAAKTRGAGEATL
ncbi:MAG: DUF1801 domain-containing protein [Acidobacteria bacterium]|nr:DUF1801 domain-containing protein [Acidobacteriota bacterium]